MAADIDPRVAETYAGQARVAPMCGPGTVDRFQPDSSPVADPNATLGESSRGRAANAPLLTVVSRSLGEAVDLPPPRQALELVLAGVLELEIRASGASAGSICVCPVPPMAGQRFYSKLSEGLIKEYRIEMRNPPAAFLIRFPVMEAMAVSVLSARL